MINITTNGGELSEKEKYEYVNYLEEKHNRKLESLTITLDGDYVDLNYKFAPVAFERIRRITGYLTGDTSTWNDAKKHELEDRVVHGGMGAL